jgi:DNA (cytosine-5)-methyltransferase 1
VNVISLFTGVGGFDLGLERAGHRIVAQCEADEKARAVLRRHWPDVPIHEDVVTYQPTESADLVAGGFPCQDLSVAGKRAGLAGERSGLFFEAARISDLVLGDGGFVLIENVPGLLSSNGGRDFAVVLATLADLGFHDLAWRVLDSRYFGVPQRRRRVFILARRARGRRAAEVLLEPESGGGDHQASREARSSLAGRTRSVVASALDQRRGGADDNDAQANHLVSHSLTSRGYDASEDGTGRGTPLVSQAVTSKWRKGSGGPAGDECQNLVSPPTDPDRVRTAPGIPGRVDDPVTCAYDPKPDGPRYAQMGNAVTVNVAEWLGHRLKEFG